MNMAELTVLVGKALGKSPDIIARETESWDSLDQLEIITHLHDALGEHTEQLEGLSNFNNLETLAAVLRKDGLID